MDVAAQQKNVKFLKRLNISNSFYAMIVLFHKKYHSKLHIDIFILLVSRAFQSLILFLTPQSYSSVPNRRACTFINFEKKFPPARPYFGLHVYSLKKIPMHVYYILQVYWYLPCTFINFEKKILPALPYFGLHV